MRKGKFVGLQKVFKILPETHIFMCLHPPYPVSLCAIVAGLKSSLMTVGVVRVQRHNSDKWIEMARAKETQQQTAAAVSTQQMTGFCLSSLYYLEVSSTVCHFFLFTYLHPLKLIRCSCSQEHIRAPWSPRAVALVNLGVGAGRTIEHTDAFELAVCVGSEHILLHAAPCEQHHKSAG